MNRFVYGIFGAVVLCCTGTLSAQTDPPQAPPVQTRTVIEEVTRQLEDGTTVIEEVTREVPINPVPSVDGAPSPNSSASQNRGQFMNNRFGAGNNGTTNSGAGNVKGNGPPPSTTRTYTDESGNRVTETIVYVAIPHVKPDGSTEIVYEARSSTRIAPNSSASSNTQAFSNNNLFPGGSTSNSPPSAQPSMNRNPVGGVVSSGTPPVAPSRSNPSQIFPGTTSSGTPPIAPSRTSGVTSSGTPPVAPPRKHSQNHSNDPPVTPPHHSSHPGDPPGMHNPPARLPIVITNKAKYGESVFYVLIDGDIKYPMSMKPGEEQRLSNDRNWIIEYQSAPGETKQYKLRGKQLYIFHPAPTGDWNFYMDDLRE